MSKIMEEIFHGGSENEQTIDSMTTLASLSKITNLKPRFIAVDIARQLRLGPKQGIERVPLLYKLR